MKTNLPIYNKNKQTGSYIGQNNALNGSKQHCIKAIQNVQ